MSDIETASFNEMAANNNAAAPNGFPEGQAPSTVNDCARELMAAIKRDWNRSHPTLASGGSANAQTLTYGNAPSAYVQGQRYSFIAGFANTGPATLNVNGLGARNMTRNGATALAGGEIQNAAVVEVMYDGTQFQIVSATPGLIAGQTISPFAGFKNALINGDMEVWQRGAGGAAVIAVGASSGAWTVDRWFFATGPNQTSTVSQVAGLTVGSQWSCKVQRNNAQSGTGVMTFEQPLTIDQIVPLRGQTVMLSLWLKAGANWSPSSGNVTINLYCGTGAAVKRGSTPYTNESTPITIIQPLSTTATKFAFAATAIVPTNTTQMTIWFAWAPTGTAGADDSFTIDEMQLEIGGSASAYDRRPFGLELSLCERFFEKSFTYGAAPLQNAGLSTGECRFGCPIAGAVSLIHYLPMRARKRASGAILTLYNPAATNAQVRNITRGNDGTGTTGVVTGDFNARIATTGVASSWLAGDELAFHYTLESEL